MPKYQIITEFASEDEMRTFLGTSDQNRAAPTIAVDPADGNDLITAERDSDEMPYNDEYHATPKSFTSSGTWRSRRGKSAEADAARAAFKAAGGPAMPALPVQTRTAVPGMPGAAAPMLPAPITYGRLVEKLTGMMTRGLIDDANIYRLYGEAGALNAAGGLNPTIFETNESARALLFGSLCRIEPELSA